MGERLFSPWSLERVCEAVEWEDEIAWRRDGTSNQMMFMQAMAVLWERWMRDWSIPDFASSIRDAADHNFVGGLERILSTFPQRISQLVGFYRGIWAGANPGAFRIQKGLFGWPIGELNNESRARAAIDRMAKELTTILEPKEES